MAIAATISVAAAAELIRTTTQEEKVIPAMTSRRRGIPQRSFLQGLNKVMLTTTLVICHSLDAASTSRTGVIR